MEIYQKKSKIIVRPIRKDEEKRWTSLLQEYHYLGFNGVLGERINYVAEENGKWVALLSWASAVLNLEARDKWIGWCSQQRLNRLKFIANNWRFLILPEYRRANLASHVLSLCLKRLSNDWMEKYKHPVIMVETFVDASLNKGTCYIADNWIRIGMSKGFSKHYEKYHFHGNKKIIFMKSLEPNGRSILGRAWTNSRLISPYERSRSMIHENKLSLFGPKGLISFCHTIKDSRSNHGKRYESGPFLAFCLLAIFSGMNSYKKIFLWGKTLTPEHLKKLKLWQAPSESGIRDFILSLDAEDVDKKFTDWFLSSDSLKSVALAFDGKVLRGSRDGKKKAIQLLSLVTHEGTVVAQRKVDSKTNEIPVAQELLMSLKIEGAVLTGDALHTQKETAATIVKEKNADFIFTVKGNQPTLKAEIENALSKSAFSP